MTSTDYLTHVRIPDISADVITQDSGYSVAYTLQLLPPSAEASVHMV